VYDDIRVGNSSPSQNATWSNVTLINCQCIGATGDPCFLAMGTQMTIACISCQFDNSAQYGFYYAYAPSYGSPNTTNNNFYFQDCDFSGNTISGWGVGGDLPLSSVTCVRCTFNNNATYGFVTYYMEDSCQLFMTNCQLTGNRYAAMYLNTNTAPGGYGSAWIQQSHFVDGTGNLGPYLAEFRTWSETTIINCIFDEGAIQLWAEGANVRVFDSDFVSTTYNTGTSLTYTKVVYYSNYQSSPNGSASINNCIFSGASTAVEAFNNTAVTINGQSNFYQNIALPYVGTTTGSNAVVNNGTIQYGAGDPKFITPSSGPGTGNFQLQNTSPCLYEGINYSFITTDYAGNPRPARANRNCDIGAYEDQTEPLPAVSVPYSLWPLFE